MWLKSLGVWANFQSIMRAICLLTEELKSIQAPRTTSRRLIDLAVKTLSERLRKVKPSEIRDPAPSSKWSKTQPIMRLGPPLWACAETYCLTSAGESTNRTLGVTRRTLATACGSSAPLAALIYLLIILWMVCSSLESLFGQAQRADQLTISTVMITC